ncbi:MAG TPA: hypothetical protein DEO65_15355 [Bacillus bacterium]|uniref:Uncharacterized protein n=1 Tax=Siminovitchia fordii TaxID=254759 RepID=A0ABQ4KDS7_9BACI|nr:hypothetical protein [Siminovitchia fordii]GIN23226.1 hypothetical protein J1TS3_43600 [Siminovitchia fordii]HBZ11216.1 hypothetical protein [Bacillus sp. (in: firmicutes)]
MDKLPKRVMYNPDGSSMMKRWDDSVIVNGKQESAFATRNPVGSGNGQKGSANIQLLDELDDFEERYLDEIGYNWATEIDYY